MKKSEEVAKRDNVTGVYITNHGMYGTLEYKTWSSMIQRCTNLNAKNYSNYGGRGISVCAAWRFFKNFFKDMGKRPSKKYTIERKDNNKGYFPENCKWATRVEQNRNRRLLKTNTTGITGVFWDQSEKRYVAHITINYKQIKLGRFVDKTDAIKARHNAEVQYWNKQTV